MLLPNRHESSNEYRYGFNGMETDKEVSGTGNSYTTQFRQYDPRLGRWKSLDPLANNFPDQSPFTAFNNNPIYFIDPLGLEGTNTEGGGEETLPHPSKAEEGDVEFTENKDSDGKVLGHTKWVLTDGEWKPIESIATPIEVKSEQSPSGKSQSSSNEMSFTQALSYWYDNTLFGRFDNMMKGIPDFDLTGNSSNRFLQGNGSKANFEGAQLTREGGLGKGGQGSGIKSEFFAEKDGMRIYMDVSDLPGSSLGFNNKLNTKVRVDIKIGIPGSMVKRTIYVSKDIFTKNEKEIYKIITHGKNLKKIYTFLEAAATETVEAINSTSGGNDSQTSVFKKPKNDTVILQLYGYLDSNMNVQIIYDSTTSTATTKANAKNVENLIIINK